MSLYDIVILFVIGIFALWGLWRGIIREAFDVAGLVIGVLAARQFAPPIGAVLPPQAVPQIVRTIIVSIVILLIIWLAVKIVGMIVRKIIRHGPVKSMDRMGGFLIGALKGILLILALAILMAATPLSNVLDALADESPVYGITMKIAKPLAKRYREAFEASIREKVKAAIPAVISTADPDNIKKVAEMLSAIPRQKSGKLSDGEADISSISISLDTISPETERAMKDVLRDLAPPGIDMERSFDLMKKSGVVIDIQLDDLDPETRSLVKMLANNPALSDVDLEKLAGDPDLNRAASKLVDKLLENPPIDDIDLKNLTRDLDIDIDELTRQLKLLEKK